MAHKFSERSEKNLQGVHPLLVRVARRALELSTCDFTVTEGLRTLETQQKYFSWGRTVVNPNTGKMTIITKMDGIKHVSKHQKQKSGYSEAIDLYPFFNGSVQLTHPDVPRMQAAITRAFEQAAAEIGVKIEFGFNWKNFPDAPHYQINL